MRVKEGYSVLVTIEDVSNDGIQITSQYAQLPFYKVSVVNVANPDLLPVGEQVPVKIVDDNSFSPKVRLLGHSHDNSDAADVPLPGDTVRAEFSFVRGDGKLVAKKTHNLHRLHTKNGIPGAELEVEIHIVKPALFASGEQEAIGQTTELVEWPTPETQVTVVHNPNQSNKNGNLDLTPKFSVPDKFPVRYQLSSFEPGQQRYGLSQFSIVDAGYLPCDGKTLTAQLTEGSSTATVHGDSNEYVVSAELANIIESRPGSVCESFEVELLEPAPCDGSATIEIVESVPGGTPRAQLEELQSISEENLTVGDIVQAETKPGSNVVETHQTGQPVTVDDSFAVATPVEVRITHIDTGEMKGELVNISQLPRPGNNVTVTYTDRTPEVSVGDYTIELESPPVFAERARVELVDELNQSDKTIPGKHQEYLSHPDVGDELEARYDHETGMVHDKESSLTLPLAEQLPQDGTVTIEVAVIDGNPAAKVVDNGSVPVEGQTIPAQTTLGKATAVTPDGHAVKLESQAKMTAQAQVTVTNLREDAIYGTVAEYTPSYLSEGERIRKYFKNNTQVDNYTRKSSPFELRLEEPAPKSHIFEIEITSIGTTVHGSIVGERDSLDIDVDDTGGVSVKRGKSSATF